MLIRFAVRNFRSYRERAVLMPGHGGKTGFTVSVWGGNGSGKTNFLAALDTLSGLALGRLPAEAAAPFLLNPLSAKAPVEFEVSFGETKGGGTVLRYRLSVKNGRIESESLCRFTGCEEEKIFSRNGMTLEACDAIRRGRAPELSPEKTVLSALSKRRVCAGAVRFFSGVRYLGESFGGAANEENLKVLMRGPMKKAAETALQALNPSVVGLSRGRNGICIVRETEQGRFRLPLSSESCGVLKLLRILPAVFDTLSCGGVLIADGLSAGLHPALIREILKLFRSETANPLGAQLIFSTHDLTGIGDKKLAAQDAWFTEKNEAGESRIYSLADTKAAKKSGFKREKAYRKGKIGAMPEDRALFCDTKEKLVFLLSDAEWKKLNGLI